MLHVQRYEGRFFGRRVNCEQVPILPAWAVAQVFDDPRETPYLLVWKSPYDGTVGNVFTSRPTTATTYRSPRMNFASGPSATW